MLDQVSVITPAFNAQKTIVRAVRSLIKQHHQNWELFLISDDGFDYDEFLRNVGIEDSRISFYDSPKIQSGPNCARNVGLSKARGEWIAPLDADDLYYPDRLVRLLEAAQATGLSLDNIHIVGEHVTERCVLDSSLPKYVTIEDLKHSVVPLLFLFHRSHISSGWDEDIVRGADTLFNYRGLESAKEAYFIKDALHEYHVHGASMCHAQGAENIFQQAYKYTLERLSNDGLGFSCETFVSHMIEMVQYKSEINDQFESAVKNGFLGNFQSFIEKHF